MSSVHTGIGVIGRHYFESTNTGNINCARDNSYNSRHAARVRWFYRVTRVWCKSNGRTFSCIRQSPQSDGIDAIASTIPTNRTREWGNRSQSSWNSENQIKLIRHTYSRFKPRIKQFKTIIIIVLLENFVPREWCWKCGVNLIKPYEILVRVFYFINVSHILLYDRKNAYL